MKSGSLIAAFAGMLCWGAAGTAQAVVLYDQNVTPNIIFGSGNANGHFTVNQEGPLELGLRAKLRFDESNQPQNTFNSNGDGTYSFAAGAAPSGFSFDPGSPTTPVWSFEWSVNSSADGTGSTLAADYFYILTIDFDPGPGTHNLEIALLSTTPAVPDHAFGTNGTAEGDGTTAGGDAGTFSALVAANNVMQNSWNMEFFNEGIYDYFDPSVPGIYTISLAAYDNSENLVADVSIDVIVTAVPEPATLGLMLLGLGGLGVVAWRRKPAPLA